jgi:hypothetical protein
MTEMTGIPGSRIEIQLMADWGASPLWVAVDGGVTDPYDLDEIHEVVLLSDDLLAAIGAWDDRFDATYDRDDPQGSGFATAEEWAAFNQEGRDLAERLQAEVPSYVTVTYEPLNGAPTEIQDQ